MYILVRKLGLGVAIKPLRKVLPHDYQLSRVKYLNNLIEQDHRFIKKRVRACPGCRSFDTAERTLQGVEVMNMIRKGQVKRLDRSDTMGHTKFVASLFQIAAWLSVNYYHLVP
jgi:transposase-like protein